MKKHILLILSAAFFVSNALAQTPKWLWAQKPGGATSDNSSGICNDLSGNVYVAGSYQGTDIIFGNYTLSSGGYLNPFLAKYDLQGNAIWAINGGGGSGEVDDVCSDTFGNVFICGHYSSGMVMSFGNFTLPQVQGMFYAKVDSSGSTVWAKGGQSATCLGVSTDPGGNVYLTGSISSDSITFDTITLHGIGKYVVKLNAQGEAVWGNVLPVGLNCITNDHHGNTYVSGSFSGTAAIDNLVLTSNGGSDLFIAKLDSLGNVKWIKGAGGSQGESGIDIVADENGNTFITGYYYSTSAAFGNFTLTASNTNGGMFIAKCDSSGNFLWVNKANGSGSDRGESVTIDHAGNSYVTGELRSTSVSFGNGITVPDPCAFVSKYDSLGNTMWVKTAGEINGDQTGYGVSVDHNNNVYVTGEFEDQSIEFDNTTIPFSGNGHDLFIARICQNVPPVPTISQSNYTLTSSAATGNQWYLAGSILSGATGQTYYPQTPGIYTVVVTDSIGCYTSSANYHIFTVSINGIAGSDDISYYPSPANNTLTIETRTGNGYYLLHDVTGKLLVTGTITADRLSLDISAFSSGIYFISISDGKQEVHGKIIKE